MFTAEILSVRFYLLNKPSVMCSLLFQLYINAPLIFIFISSLYFRGLRCSWEGLALLDSILPTMLLELEMFFKKQYTSRKTDIQRDRWQFTSEKYEKEIAHKVMHNNVKKLEEWILVSDDTFFIY